MQQINFLSVMWVLVQLRTEIRYSPMMNPSTLLTAERLGAVRNDRLLFDPIDLCLVAGECLWVQGQNGSGKTSLLHVLCGLLPTCSGKYFWKNSAVNDFIYVGHKDSLHPALRVYEHLYYQPSAPSRERIQTALEHMALGALSNRLLSELSVGQQRRLALVRLLLSNATTWILDEPLVGLDKASIKRVQTLVSAHLAGGGAAIITSHQPLDAIDNVTHLLLKEATCV